MKGKIIAIIGALVLLVVCAAGANAKVHVIGLTVSDSNDLSPSKEFVAMGKKLQKKVEELNSPDSVDYRVYIIEFMSAKGWFITLWEPVSIIEQVPAGSEIFLVPDTGEILQSVWSRQGKDLLLKNGINLMAKEILTHIRLRISPANTLPKKPI